jgi:deoxyribonuclease V
MHQLTLPVNTAPIPMLPQLHSPIIINTVKIEKLHDWRITVFEAKQIQRELASKVSHQGNNIRPKFICGVDISAPNTAGFARAAAVVLNYPELETVEVKTIEDKPNFPYIPGLLSFREAPLILTVCEQLSIEPDLLIVDGQGIAHPRRFGIASHLGVILNIPTIGCAKSRLCGTHSPVTSEAGDYAELTDNGDVIGVALRSKVGTKPIYISIGHMIDLPTAIDWVRRCCRSYRLPEPSRLAHIAASGKSMSVSTSRT